MYLQRCQNFFTFILKYYTCTPIRGIKGLIIHCLCLQHSFETTSFSLCFFFFFFFLIPKRRALRVHFNYIKSSILSHKRSELQPSFDTYKWNVKGIEFTDRNINNISMSAFSPSDKHYISSSCIRIIERMTHSFVVIRI